MAETDAPEKVEMTNVPLMQGEKTDEEKKAETGKKGGLFKMFSREKKTEEKTETDAPAEAAKECEAKVKTQRRWFTCSKKGAQANGPEGDQPAKEMTIGINMLDRDEKSVNEHVKLGFEDIFAEPDSVHSVDCAWRMTYRVFTGVRSGVYRLLALFFALPCALLWGLIFALLTCINIWACTPAGRALLVPATWLAKVWDFIVTALFGPLFRSCGLCFSNIKLNSHVRTSAVGTDAAVHVA